jgi:hypothetical protein
VRPAAARPIPQAGPLIQEEDLLFAAMEDHRMGGEGGPIDAMREEHRIGRALVGAMNEAAPKAEHGRGAPTEIRVTGPIGKLSGGSSRSRSTARRDSRSSRLHPS